MSFLTSSDYDASIHEEILTAITRNDPAAVTLAEDMAIEEMKGYMAQRYKVEVIFAKTGTDRNKLVIMFLIDLVLYHLHSAHNPMRFPKIREDRYKRAIEWLKQVQKGEIVPNGLEQVEGDDGYNGGAISFEFASHPKRDNAW